MKLKFIEIAIILSLFICIISCLSFERDCSSIREKVLRLHVIANSDSEEDQALKLKVRDRIIEESGELFALSENTEEAEQNLKNALGELSALTEKVIMEEGSSYSVEVRAEPSYFPTKSYGNLTLPAGTYKSLKVIIGEGKGQNWWCVLFPPLCLPAAEKREELLSDVLTAKEIKLVSAKPEYEVRFWIAEKLQEFKNSYKTKG